jgi:hypothetical protein
MKGTIDIHFVQAHRISASVNPTLVYWPKTMLDHYVRIGRYQVSKKFGERHYQTNTASSK